MFIYLTEGFVRPVVFIFIFIIIIIIIVIFFFFFLLLFLRFIIVEGLVVDGYFEIRVFRVVALRALRGVSEDAVIEVRQNVAVNLYIVISTVTFSSTGAELFPTWISRSGVLLFSMLNK